MGAMFGLMKESGWERETVREGLEVFGEVPLEVGDVRLPNGLRYHVIDVYVDELERVGALKDGGKGLPLGELLEPLRKLGKESPTKDVRRRCKEALEDERVPGNEKEVKGGAEVEWGGIKD